MQTCQERQDIYNSIKSDTETVKSNLAPITTLPPRGTDRDQVLKTLHNTYKLISSIRERMKSLTKSEADLYLESLGLDIEWGPELGVMSWDKANEEIVKLNLTLKPGEKPWRLPTKEELEKITESLRNAYKTHQSDEIKEKLRQELQQKLNTQTDYYWSGITCADDTDIAWVVFFDDGYVYYSDKANDRYVRCVR